MVNYTRNNSRRAYWCACFLYFDAYLCGNDPDIPLALLLLDNDITRRMAGRPTRGETADLIRFHVLAALLACRDNQPQRAGRYKGWVVRTMSRGEYQGVMPALPPDDRARYDSLQARGHP